MTTSHPDLLQQGPHRLTGADQISTAGRRPRPDTWLLDGLEAALAVSEELCGIGNRQVLGIRREGQAKLEGHE